MGQEESKKRMGVSQELKLFSVIKIFVFQYQYLIIFYIYDNDAL